MKLSELKHLNKTIIGLMIALLAQSCVSKSQSDQTAGQDDSPLRIQNEKYKDTPLTRISESADTLIVFPDSYPVGVRISDGNIFIKTVMCDTCISVYDKETLSLIWKTGIEGNGPEDVLTPYFFESVTPDSLGRFQMADVSANSHLYLNTNAKRLTKSRLPDYVGYSSSINWLEHYCIATKNNDECMFYIHDKNTGKTLPVAFDIACSEDVISEIGLPVGYILSGMTYADENKGRIIVPHYFFDMYSVYDFSGKLLRKISLSENDYNEQKAAENLLTDKGFTRFCPGFCDSEACYLSRIYSSAFKGGKVEAMQIVKTDWEGTPQMVYVLDNELSGDFCIDENKLYGIVKTEDGDNETYSLVRWNL